MEACETVHATDLMKGFVINCFFLFVFFVLFFVNNESFSF